MNKKLILLLLTVICSVNFILCDDIDNLLNPDMQDISNPDSIQDETENCLSAEQILELITPAPGETCNPADNEVCPPSNCLINIPAVLKENLYKRTTGPVTTRFLLDEPTLRQYCLRSCDWRFTSQAFYSFSPRVFFSENSPFINSYIDLTNKNVIDEINRAIELSGCDKVDIPGILGLFKNIKLQQHRAGFTFGFCKTFNNLSLSFNIPLYYLINHFFLSNEEINAIKNAPFFSSDNINTNPEASSEEIVTNFVLKHLVSDKVGFGDTRFNALFQIYERKNSYIWLGAQATLPTEKTFASGLIGGKFNPCKRHPKLNIQELFNLYICPETEEEKREANIEIQDTVTNFLVGTLDRLSTILINAPLGNGGHFGFGPQLDIIHEFNDCWSMHTYAALEGFTKNKENRFFLEKKKPEEFERNFRDENKAEENLLFLNQQLINTFFPKRLCIDVRPGIKFKFAHSFVYTGDYYHGLLGFDYWFSGHEKLYVDKRMLNKFDIKKGTRPDAQQGKLFFELGYRDLGLYDRILWDVSLRGDGTVFNKGIGENYTFALRFTLDF